MSAFQDRERVLQMLLSSASEDCFGLYEAVWEVNSAFANESLGWKYDVAREALWRLYQDGFIQFEKVVVKDGDRRSSRVEDSETAAILDNPVSWYPEYDGTRIVFTCTEAGLKKYFGG